MRGYGPRSIPTGGGSVSRERSHDPTNRDGLFFQTSGEETRPSQIRRSLPRRTGVGRCCVALPRAKSPHMLRRPAGGGRARRQDSTITGGSLIEWSPAQPGFEVAQANPGLCAVLEDAALRYASGHAAKARELLEQGVADRPRHEALAARVARAVRPAAARGRQGGVRPVRAAIRRPVRASAPAWEAAEKPQVGRARVIGGYIGSPASSRPRRNAARRPQARDGEASAGGPARPDVGDGLRRRGRAPARRRARRRAAREVRTAAAARRSSEPRSKRR